MPVRIPTNRGGRKHIGWFPSRKLGRMVRWESPLERDYIYYPELDPDVIEYEEQPLTIAFPRSSKFKQYTPDFSLQRHSSPRPIIIEVKTDEALTDSEVRDRLETARPLIEAQGFAFAVVTSSQIRLEPRLYNLKLLFRYADYIVSLQDRLTCQRCFEDRPTWTVGDLTLRLTGLNRPSGVPLALLAEGALLTDLTQRIDDKSILVTSAARALTSPEGKRYEQWRD